MDVNIQQLARLLISKGVSKEIAQDVIHELANDAAMWEMSKSENRIRDKYARLANFGFEEIENTIRVNAATEELERKVGPLMTK